MQYNTMQQFLFTADYYRSENTAAQNELPNWQDTYIKTIRIHLDNSVSFAKMNLTAQEQLTLGYILKNIKDVNGNIIQVTTDNTLGIETGAWRINACDPKINAFGWADNWIVAVSQLSLLRPA